MHLASDAPLNQGVSFKPRFYKRKREKEGKKGKRKEKRKEKGTAKILDGSFVETILRDNIENTTACSDQNILAKLDVYYSGTVGQFNCIC